MLRAVPAGMLRAVCALKDAKDRRPRGCFVTQVRLTLWRLHYVLAEHQLLGHFQVLLAPVAYFGARGVKAARSWCLLNSRSS